MALKNICNHFEFLKKCLEKLNQELIPNICKHLHPIHLQWVPSHVGLSGNEVADDLAKAATSDPVDPEDHMVLTSTLLYTHGTFKDTLDPPYHLRVPDHIRWHSRDFLLVT
ncbi:UNVERIFIED_CONTAM: hypothetical protein NCL1_12809 [Trichonephila clavipes]